MVAPLSCTPTPSPGDHATVAVARVLLLCAALCGLVLFFAVLLCDLVLSFVALCCAVLCCAVRACACFVLVCLIVVFVLAVPDVDSLLDNGLMLPDLAPVLVLQSTTPVAPAAPPGRDCKVRG